jgi:hypothetical protein
VLKAAGVRISRTQLKVLHEAVSSAGMLEQQRKQQMAKAEQKAKAAVAAAALQQSSKHLQAQVGGQAYRP